MSQLTFKQRTKLMSKPAEGSSLEKFLMIMVDEFNEARDNHVRKTEYKDILDARNGLVAGVRHAFLQLTMDELRSIKEE